MTGESRQVVGKPDPSHLRSQGLAAILYRIPKYYIYIYTYTDLYSLQCTDEFAQTPKPVATVFETPPMKRQPVPCQNTALCLENLPISGTIEIQAF